MHDDATYQHATNLADVIARHLYPVRRADGRTAYAADATMPPRAREVWRDVVPHGRDAYGDDAATDDASDVILAASDAQTNPDALADANAPAQGIPERLPTTSMLRDALAWTLNDADHGTAYELNADQAYDGGHDPAAVALAARMEAARRHAHTALANLLDAATNDLAEYTDAVAEMIAERLAARVPVGVMHHADALRDVIADEGAPYLCDVAAYRSPEDVADGIARTFARLAAHGITDDVRAAHIALSGGARP